MSPVPFFVGTNGSGTTLHRAIFDSHPDLAIPGEGRFVVALARRRARYEGDRFDTDRLLRDLRERDRFEAWGLDLGDAREALSHPPVADYPDAVRRLYSLFARSHGKSRWGDKTQANIHHLRLLAELFPEARFIHVVRDGRDVALAHTEGTRIEQVALSWRRRVGAGREAGRRLGPDLYLESRYEELIDDPEASVRRICDLIELPFVPQMLRYYERAGDIVATTAAPGRHKDVFLPPTKGLTDWRRDLPDDQVARFEALAGELLEDLGYERRFDRVPLATRTAVLRQVAADGVRYAMHRTKTHRLIEGGEAPRRLLPVTVFALTPLLAGLVARPILRAVGSDASGVTGGPALTFLAATVLGFWLAARVSQWHPNTVTRGVGVSVAAWALLIGILGFLSSSTSAGRSLVSAVALLAPASILVVAAALRRAPRPEER